MYTHFQNEIQKGLWMLAPQVASRYLQALNEKQENPEASIFDKQIEAMRMFEVATPEGERISAYTENIPDGSVGVIKNIGPMVKYGNWYYWGTDELVEMAIEFDNNPAIVGTIFNDDSGGGAVSSIPPWITFLKNKKKPVVSLCDMSASANLWKNVHTDFFMAENNVSSMFGSIGVMLELYDDSKFLKDLGYTRHVIEADLSDDKNKAYKLALDGKYELIKEEFLNPLAIKFQEQVKEARPNLKLETPGVLSGKMFYAEEALEIGLIDGIGTMEEAIEKVHMLSAASNIMNY